MTISNEILLILSIFIYFGILLIAYKIFGKTGIYIWNVMALIFANIEVQLFVDAYTTQMTLGNVCFSSSFLATDIICEKYGKKEANKAVNYGIFAGIVFIIVTNFWLMFSPLNQDMFDAFNTVFNGTKRIVLSGFIVYAIVQKLDIIIYHIIWNLTSNKYKDKQRFLWLRNNLATIISQFLNAILFNVFAFYGIVSNTMLLNFIISTFIIAVIIAIVDTPFLYLARKINPIEYN